VVTNPHYKFLKKSVNLVPKTGWGTTLLPEHISKVFQFPVSLCFAEVLRNCIYSAFDEKRPKHTFCQNFCPDIHSWNTKLFSYWSVWILSLQQT
jgi:hypothetical protein